MPLPDRTRVGCARCGVEIADGPHGCGLDPTDRPICLSDEACAMRTLAAVIVRAAGMLSGKVVPITKEDT